MLKSLGNILKKCNIFTVTYSQFQNQKEGFSLASKTKRNYQSYAPPNLFVGQPEIYSYFSGSVWTFHTILYQRFQVYGKIVYLHLLLSYAGIFVYQWPL